MRVYQYNNAENIISIVSNQLTHVSQTRGNLKGVFAKNERGYRLTAQNKRF